MSETTVNPMQMEIAQETTQQEDKQKLRVYLAVGVVAVIVLVGAAVAITVSLMACDECVCQVTGSEDAATTHSTHTGLTNDAG